MQDDRESFLRDDVKAPEAHDDTDLFAPDGTAEPTDSSNDEEFDIETLFRSEKEFEEARHQSAPPKAPSPQPAPVATPDVTPLERVPPAPVLPPPPVAATAVAPAPLPPPSAPTPPQTPQPAAETVKQRAAVPARTLEFPVEPPHEHAADDAQTASLSIADLIENHVRVEWHEAVAIARDLCRVMSRDPGANVRRSLVEPWNVEITKDGQIFVLPGGSSSDPLVRQVGRVLLALLQDSIAPAELRLVASQAAFEVPIYSSVDELSVALRHFERPGNLDAIRAAFSRGLEAKFAGGPLQPEPPQPPIPPEVEHQREVAEASMVLPSRARARPRVNDSGRLKVAAVVAAGIVVGAVSSAALLKLAAGPRDVSTGAAADPIQAEVIARTLTAPLVVIPSLSSSLTAVTPAAPATLSPERGGARGAPRGGSLSPRNVDVADLPAAPAARTAEAVARPAASASDTYESAERRAGALLAEGRNSEAAAIFDSIVVKSPLYQLDPARSSSEALAAFQNSKRQLLPGMARRSFQEAKAAYDAGDFPLTLTKTERALALMKDADVDADEGLSGEISNLAALATAAKALEESKVYTSADRDVTPPRPIGRQLSTASLSGRVPVTGRLELLVSRTGEVETVRLETPVNGYHDRMLVSAAKAWHYRPALRKGRPVRYSMVMTITLPDF